jgi:hypothetical protein
MRPLPEYIYCMLVREISKCIHPRVPYSLRATPEGNIILVGDDTKKTQAINNLMSFIPSYITQK